MASPARLIPWQPNPAKLSGLVEVLNHADSPDNAIQEEIYQTLTHYNTLPDAVHYFATILCDESLLPRVRELAGLTLKNYIMDRQQNLHQEALEFVKVIILHAIEKPDKAVKNAIGTLTTTILSLYGIQQWPEVLRALRLALDSTVEDAFESALSALCKICEDELHRTLSTLNDSMFVQFCSEELLPKLFSLCTASSKPSHRERSFYCISLFVQARAFAPHAHFESFFPQYWMTLGNLATIAEPLLQKLVVEGIVHVVEFRLEVILNSADAIFPFMSSMMNHEDYNIRLEAVEFWPVILKDNPNLHPSLKGIAVEIIRKHLDKFLPILVHNTIYTDRDYMSMDRSLWEENANVPDHAQDVAPRFHQKERENIEDADDIDEDFSRPWGVGWTLRKGSALALDQLATIYPEEVLRGVLPLIEQNIEHKSWQIQESAVLTLGAIASGCMSGLWPYLFRVMRLLLSLSQTEVPLLRSISCWCISRFSSWFCHSSNSEQWLGEVLKVTLNRVLDTNKSVQEAACSAFASIEEEARDLLIPHLNEIVGTLLKAFAMYQTKNLMILYDAIGTLAESVNGALHQNSYGNQLINPLLQRWISLSNDDPSLVALFECITCCVGALNEEFFQFATNVFTHCILRIKANINEVEPSRHQIIECSLDLLSALTAILGERAMEFLTVNELNFIPLLDHCCGDPSGGVLQSAFALVGDLSKCCFKLLEPHLHSILSKLTDRILNSTASVSNNAGWAIGEIVIHLNSEKLEPHIDDMLSKFSILLQRKEVHTSLLQNTCITLGRLGYVSPKAFANCSLQMFDAWFEIMAVARTDSEKVLAFEGICSVITENPRVLVVCFPKFCRAILSFNPCPVSLQQPLHIILEGFVRTYPDQWNTFWNSSSLELQEELSKRFYVSPEQR